MKTSYQEIPGLAAIIEVGVNSLVKLPVEPMLFRLLRVGKLIRAIRMVSWDERVGGTNLAFEGALRCEPFANQVFLTFLEQFPENNGPFMFQPVSNRFKFGWEGVGD